MRRRVNPPEGIDGDVRVDLSGLEARVPEQRLNEADVRTALQHVRRAGVAKDVRGVCGRASFGRASRRYRSTHANARAPIR